MIGPGTVDSTDSPKRLFCFPYAGGGASAFRSWHLPGTAIYAVQPPGREDQIQEAPIDSMDSLSSAACEALLPLLDRPFAFFGHCLGGLVAYEVARLLEARHHPPPQILIVSAVRPPHMSGPQGLRNLLTDDQFIAWLRTIGGTPEAALQNRRLMAMVLPALRADYSLYCSHVTDRIVPLHCPLLSIGGDCDPMVSLEEVMAWRYYATQFETRIFPGGHFFFASDEKRFLPVLSDFLM